MSRTKMFSGNPLLVVFCLAALLACGCGERRETTPDGADLEETAREDAAPEAERGEETLPQTVDDGETAGAKLSLAISERSVTVTSESVDWVLDYKWRLQIKDISNLRLKVVVTGGGLAYGASYTRSISPLHGKVLTGESEQEYDLSTASHLYFAWLDGYIHFAMARSGMWEVPGLDGTVKITISIVDSDSEQPVSNVLTVLADCGD